MVRKANKMASAIAIERIENPTAEFFRHHYLTRGRPVVIVNKRDPLPQHEWSFERLTQMAGELKVPVYDWGEKGPTTEDDFFIKQMEFAEAIRHAATVTHTSRQRYSVCQLPIEFLPPLEQTYQTPPFLADVDVLDRVPALFRERHRRALFISFFRGMHFHNGREALTQLLSGRKQFTLYSPKDSRYLYPRKLSRCGWGWFDETEQVFCSEIPFENGIEQVDRERFPLFQHATPYQVELQPGESLYIPTHWWHFTHAVEPCVLVVEFWDAPLRRWGYPIAWRSLVMKPYRKYLYRHVIKLKKFSRNSQVLKN